MKRDAGGQSTLAIPMLKPVLKHRWNLTPTDAIALQEELAGKIQETRLSCTPRLIAGADCAFSPDGESIIAGWIVWDLIGQRVIETATAIKKTAFPYVPGLLSFREIPSLLAAAARLKSEPDVLMLDGQGRAHPRRLGIACHLGLVLDRPSLGCAKSRLCGEHKEPAAARGSQAALTDEGEKIGRVLRTRRGLKPVYVSVGHRITLDEAVKVVMRCCTKYRLPEPSRLAHELVTCVREQMK